MSCIQQVIYSRHMLPCLISRDHNRLPATLQAEWNVEKRVQFFWCKGYHIFLSSLDLDAYKRNVGQDWASPETILKAGLPRRISRVQIPEVTPLFFTASLVPRIRPVLYPLRERNHYGRYDFRDGRHWPKFGTNRSNKDIFHSAFILKHRQL